MTKRVSWIDMAKGFGIILVIYGHIAFRPDSFNVWLCSFHMPLFFFLSGITFNADKYNKFGFFLKTKIKQLVIPYFIFAFAAFIWKVVSTLITAAISGSNINTVGLLKQFAGIFLQIRGTEYGIGVWFIPCIFISFILLYFIQKLANKKWYVSVILASISFTIGYLYCSYVQFNIPWSVDAAFAAVFFMVIGNVLKPWLMKQYDKKYTVPVGLAALLLNIVFAYLNFKVIERPVGMWSNNYGNPVWFILESAFGIIFAVCLCQIITSKFVIDIGHNSIFYYGIHSILIQMAAFVTSRIPWADYHTAVAFIASTALVIVIVLILKLTYPVYEKIYNGTIKKLKLN